MSEELMQATAAMPADQHAMLYKAIAAGCAAEPAKAAEAVAANLTGMGPWVQTVIDLIKKGVDNLPAILTAVQAAGIVLPSWATLVINILLAVFKTAA